MRLVLFGLVMGEEVPDKDGVTSRDQREVIRCKHNARGIRCVTNKHLEVEIQPHVVIPYLNNSVADGRKMSGISCGM